MATIDCDFRPCSVLVVEDNPFERKIMVGILKAFEVGNVVDCSNVDDAIGLMIAKTYDCAIVDWLMSPREGIEFIRHVRKSSASRQPDLSIILCTGLTDYERIGLARDAGVDEVIAKPYCVEEVYRKLSAAIFRRRSFIEFKTYVGPDRRRRQIEFNGPDRRGRFGLSQDQIDGLMDDLPTGT